MPFSATVYNVLIASPSDVPEERQAIAQALNDWNTLHSQATGMILLPVMWETHSVPAMGDRPQALINNRVVRGCDMLIGSFWTRLGSPTGLEESGTVEEVKWFLNNKKPVMLYYSKAQIDHDVVDLDQLKKLREFKSSIRDKGIQEDYKSCVELKEKLSRQLTIVMRDMDVSPSIDKRTVQAAKASTKNEKDDESDQPRRKAKPASKAGSASKPIKAEIWLEDYTDRAFIVRGDTSPFKDALRDEGGRWITVRDNSKAWMFSKRHVEAVAKIMKIKPVLRAASC